MATTSEAALCAELNDLLQLDHDAVQAYALAIRGLSDAGYRLRLDEYRADHQRHIEELTAVIRAHGGLPVQLPHLPTGPMKLAVQGLGDLAGDTAVLLAFKSNERLSRDKYRRAAEAGHPEDVQRVVARGAEDESRHYDWVVRTLEERGAGADTRLGRAEAAFEIAHTRAADLIESGERRVMHGAEALRQGAMRALTGTSTQLGSGGMRNVLIAVGVGFVAAQLFGRSDAVVARRRSRDARDRLRALHEADDLTDVASRPYVRGRAEPPFGDPDGLAAE